MEPSAKDTGEQSDRPFFIRGESAFLGRPSGPSETQINMPVDIFPVDWKAVDSKETEKFEIQLFGKTATGDACTVYIKFYPYFFVGMPQHWSPAKIKLFIADAAKKYNAHRGFSTLVKRKTLHGFTNNQERSFAQLAFESHDHYKRARYGIQRNERLQTYEASLEPLLRFFHVQNIEPSRWIRIDSEPTSDHIYRVDFRDVGPSPVTSRPPLVFASWDIEAISESGKFPNSDLPGDKVITIGTAFQRYGEPAPFHRVVVTLDTCDDIPGVEVIPCENEADLINAWLQVIRQHDTDVMVGYNTYQFDLRYIYGRSTLSVGDMGEPLVDLSLLGKGTGGGEPVEKNLSSAAYGDNKFFLLSSPGIIQIDLLQIFRRELKLDSYSLGNVSTKYLDGETKLDLLPGEIFSKFRGSSSDRAEIATYCIRDVELPLKLMEKMTTFENLLEMSNATCVPIEYLTMRGQQIKVFSLLLKKARALGFLAPDLERTPGDGGKYEGATVLEAKKGGYFGIISALDYSSLYPSIIRAHNMCPSTLVLDETYGDIEGVEYYTIETGGGEFKFAQDVTSVVPALLEDLASFRKQAKKDMAKAKEDGNDFAAALFNAKQLAFKVSMNSVYGFFGATKGMFPCVPIASSVTATGRKMIEHSKKMAEELVPGTEVIYGDSVAYYTPIIVRHPLTGVRFTTFEDITRDRCWKSYNGGKEACELGDYYEIWSDTGWTTLHRVIRHRLSPHKQMIRIVTPTGLVDVTSDHSLLFADGTPVRPVDIGIGSELLHRDVPIDDFSEGILRATRVERHDFWSKESVTSCLQPSHHLLAAYTFAVGQSLWTDVSMTYARDGCQLAMELGKSENSDTVVTLCPVDYAEGQFVYDATTENHHFAAGIGRMVVHNTDSILCKFKVADHLQDDMREHFRVAQDVADKISATFKYPIELEFEKCYKPYLLFTKKRYAGLLYTKPDGPDYIDVKGLQLVRRDSAPIVKDVSNAILDSIMYSGSTSSAIQRARSMVSSVLNGQVPLEKFIVSKQLRANYANPESQPHVIVARKIMQRRGYPVTQGERVPYVFIEDKKNIAGLISSRAEDPAYVTEHGLEVDKLYYLKNQLMSPITALLEVLVDNVDEEILGEPEIQKKLQELEIERKKDINVSKRLKLNSTRKQYEITHFFKFQDD